jgi:hypothetical protein
MTVKAITSQFNHQGISPEAGLCCVISAQAWINQDHAKLFMNLANPKQI